MHFYCSFCDKEVETDPKKHRGCGRLIQTHTFNDPKFSDKNKIFYDMVLNHDKKLESYTIEVIFTMEPDNNSDPTFKTIDCYLFNSPITNLESHLKLYLKFYQVSEMSIQSIQKKIIKTFSDTRYMTYQLYNNNPMQMVERRLNMIID